MVIALAQLGHVVVTDDPGRADAGTFWPTALKHGIQ
jgi:hypothetical protein